MKKIYFLLYSRSELVYGILEISVSRKLNSHQDEYFPRYMPKCMSHNFSFNFDKNVLGMIFFLIVDSSLDCLSVNTPCDTIFQLSHFRKKRKVIIVHEICRREKFVFNVMRFKDSKSIHIHLGVPLMKNVPQ